MSGTDVAVGYRVAGGPGPTEADLEDLAFACGLLERAADQLDTASFALARAMLACDPCSRAGIEARHALHAAHTGSAAPWRAADHLRALAAALRRVIELYDGAESAVHRAMRAGIATSMSLLAERPLSVAALSVVGLGVGVGGVVVGTVLGGMTRLLSVQQRSALEAVGRDLPGRLTADGRAELLLLAVGSSVRASRDGLQIPTLRPVPGAATALFGAVPAAGPMVLLARVSPPQLAAPRTTADVLHNVALSYDREPAPLVPGDPEGVISVQELTHPDGTRALGGRDPRHARTGGRTATTRWT